MRAASSAPGFLITNTNDNGTGSLRQAILDSNNATGSTVNTISLAIPGGGVQAIALKSALPAITQAVTLDTLSPYTATPLLALDGTQAGSTAVGLDLKTSHITLRGLIIDSFGGGGVLVEGGANDTISGSYIGVNAAGNTALGNGGFGVKIQGGARGDIIGGTGGGSRNLISGNAGDGIVLTDPGTSGNSVYADYIGTDFTGKLAVANTGNGVVIENGAAGNTIGGPTIGIDVIAGNGGNGVLIDGAGTADNSVQGTYIGTDFTGTSTLGNAQVGAEVAAGATNNTIGDGVRRKRHYLGQHGLRGLSYWLRHDGQCRRGRLHRHGHHRHQAPVHRIRRGGHR